MGHATPVVLPAAKAAALLMVCLAADVAIVTCEALNVAIDAQLATLGGSTGACSASEAAVAGTSRILVLLTPCDGMSAMLLPVDL